MTDQIVAGLKREASRIEEDCTLSAKGHFVAASGWEKRHYRIGIPSTIGAGIGGVSIISNYPIIGAAIAGIVAVASGILTFLNPMEKSAKHLSAGNSFNELKNKARFFSEVELGLFTTLGEAKSALEKLAFLKDELNKSSRQIPRWAFEVARKGVESGEATYQVDK